MPCVCASLLCKPMQSSLLWGKLSRESLAVDRSLPIGSVHIAPMCVSACVCVRELDDISNVVWGGYLDRMQRSVCIEGELFYYINIKHKSTHTLLNLI